MALTKAKFQTADNKEIPVHFNPETYRIVTRTTRLEPLSQFESARRALALKFKEKVDVLRDEELFLELHFDTFTHYTDMQEPVTAVVREDVRVYTDQITKLAGQQKGKNQVVTFIWGSLSFEGTIDSVDQKFTMFMDDGRPVRAVLSLKMASTDTPRQGAFTDGKAGDNINWSDGSWKDTLGKKAKELEGQVRSLLEG